MDWIDSYNLADCAARVLAQHRPAEHALDSYLTDPRSLRSFMRRPAVDGLRALWRSGDADVRSAVACRVAVWVGMDSDRVHAIGRRVREREQARTRLVELPAASWSTTQFNCEIASL